MTTGTVSTELLDDMRAFAATLRGSQAVGARRLIDHFDPASAPADAPKGQTCAHGTALPGDCAGCTAGAKTTHVPDMRTFTNQATMRRSVLCCTCGRNVSWYRHTGERS